MKPWTACLVLNLFLIFWTFCFQLRLHFIKPLTYFSGNIVLKLSNADHAGASALYSPRPSLTLFHYSVQRKRITVCSEYFQQRFCYRNRQTFTKSLVSFKWDLNGLLTAGVQPTFPQASAGWKTFDWEVKEYLSPRWRLCLTHLSAPQQSDRIQSCRASKPQSCRAGL